MIFGLLLLAFFLRLINLNQSVWLDEAISTLAAKELSFWHFVTGYPKGDFHPPLYFAILWVWERIFGISEVSIRMPSVIFAIGTIFLTYLIGKEVFNKRIGFLSAVLLTTNPLHIFYSQEARMYSLAAFAAVFSYYSLINLVRGKKFFIPIYGFSLSLVLYSDYLVYLVLISQLIYVLCFEREKFNRFFMGLILGVITLAPWSFIFINQFLGGINTAKGVPGWANVVGGASLKDLGLVFIKPIFGRVNFVDKNLYAFLAAAAAFFYAYIFWVGFRKFDKNVINIALWVIVAPLVAFFISDFIPVLAYFRLLFIVPGICILLAKGAEGLNYKYKKIIITLLVSLNLFFSGLYFLNPRYQREDWKGLVSFLEKRVNNGVVVIFEDSRIPAPFLYYSAEITTLPAIKNFPAKEEYDVVNLDKEIGGGGTVYLVEYLVDISDPARLVKNRIEKLGFINTNIYNFNGVGFLYEYIR